MPPPFRPSGPPSFSPKPFPKKLKPVNPRPSEGKDHAAEAELYCRTVSTRVLDEYILKLKKQLQVAEAIRAERKAVEAKYEVMTTAELEAVVAAAVPGPELSVAQMVLHARKPPAAKPKKTMPPKPPRRTPPPRRA
jgi:hypothetical protein